MMGGSVGAATTPMKIASVPESDAEHKDTIAEKFEPEDGATDDDDISLSILESTSSNLTDLPVPTDEELFAVGWAKALDPNTGSHYYYTLDRSQIVWDNPLIPAGSDGPPEATALASSSTSSNGI